MTTPRRRWWASTLALSAGHLIAAGITTWAALIAQTKPVALGLAAIAGWNLASAGQRILARAHERHVWRWGWGVGFAAAWHTQHVIGEGGVPGPVLRAMLHDEGSPVPEPWDDWTADLHPPGPED
jgi:hypothetical protein